MKYVRTLATTVAPLLILGTMATALRMGAESPGMAAFVVPAPAPKTGDRIVWQVRVLREARRIRDAAPAVPLDVVALARGARATWSGTTNLEGVAEAELHFAQIAAGDPVDIEVRSGATLLAKGVVAVPAGVAPRAAPALVATKADGPLSIVLTAPLGGVPPALDSAIWLRVAGPGAEGARVALEGEAGLEIAAPSVVPCAGGRVKVPVRAGSHLLALRATATAQDGTASSWYGALPVVPGGDEIAIEPPRPAAGAPLKLVVKSPTPKPLVYIELYDDVGRVAAATRELTPVPGAPMAMPTASVDVPSAVAGRYFAVVSSRADGFVQGTAVSRAFLVGEALAEATATGCDASADRLLFEPPSFARGVALDGFVRRYEAARETRRSGTRLAMFSLTLGIALAGLMIWSAMRQPKRRVDEMPEEAVLRQNTTPRWLAVIMLASLACLAYLMLAGLVLYAGD